MSSNRPNLTLDEFINRSKAIHGDKYGYDRTTFVDTKTAVTLTCNEHGDFNTQAGRHMYRGIGCPKCANATKGAYHKRDTAWFIEEATKVHSSKYDYSKVEYTSFHDKVEIICPVHGSFHQTAVHISAKQGCNVCSYQDVEGGCGVTRFKNHPEIKELPGILYIIKCSSDEEEFVKIGITRKPLSQRFGGHARLPYNYEEVAIKSETVYELFLLEQKLKREYKESKYRPKSKFCGHTECFDTSAVDQLVASIA